MTYQIVRSASKPANDVRTEGESKPVDSVRTECASKPAEGIRTAASEAAAETGAAAKKADAKLTLFTTATCPNCRAAKARIVKAGFSCETVLAEQQPQRCEQYGIMSVPALVSETGDDAQVYIGMSEIIRFLDSSCVKTA